VQIVTEYGTMWARNPENIAKIPSNGNGGRGVYILFDGSMPMYVGKGNIKSLQRDLNGCQFHYGEPREVPEPFRDSFSAAGVAGILEIVLPSGQCVYVLELSAPE
jgi:hypothetical protein